MHLYISAGSTCVLFVILLAIYIGMDTPFSMVYKYWHSYQETLKLARYKNNARTTKALDYIYSLSGSTGRISDFERSIIDVLIVIVTVSRDKEPRSEKTGYLPQTAASMDKLVKSDKYCAKKFMFVCNVDENPIRHIDSIMLQNYLPYIQKHGHNNLGLNASKPPELRGSGLVDEARNQETVDYAFCLNVSISFNHRYVLVVEDDVIPHNNVFEVLHHTLKYRLNAHTFDYDKTVLYKNFSFLKSISHRDGKGMLLKQKIKNDIDAFEKRVTDTLRNIENEREGLKIDMRMVMDKTIEELKENEGTITSEFQRELNALKNITESVIKPRVAFSVKTPADLDLAIGETVIYGEIIFNEGNGYDNTTGIFTAPVFGAYIFSIQFCSTAGDGFGYAVMSKERELKRGWVKDSDYNNCHSAEAVDILGKADRVWVKCSDPSILIDDVHHWNTFNGVLVH